MTDSAGPHPELDPRADPDVTPRHFVQYALYRLDPQWRLLPLEERTEQIEQLTRVIEAWSERMMVRTFTTVGVRADAELVLWRATPDFDLLQQMQTDIYATELGCRLTPTYVYTATTKPSEYLKDVSKIGFRRPRPLDVVPIDAKYMIVYPFIKRRDWYSLPAEERGAAMREHATIGRKYPSIKLNTAYSFGIDDQEFMVAFETDVIHDFLDLMLELRPTVASSYTEVDTPIFTCIRMDVRDALESLGGVGSPVSVLAPAGA